MSTFGAVYLKDESGVAYGIKQVSNKPRVSSMPYLYDIAEGNVSGHTSWEKIGYCATSGTTARDVWSYAADVTINLPTGATAMEVYTESANDRASDIFSGTSDGGSTIQLVDSTKDFTAGTPVAIGDMIILDETGAAGTPEFGYVTAVTNATTLAVAGGFSSGGTGSTRAYSIIDVSAYSGAHCVLIKYLTTAYAEKSEIVQLAGLNTGTDLVNTDVFRVNSMRVISAGTGGTTASHVRLWDADGSVPYYTYISGGYTRARNSLYTVPAGKTLYITQISGGYSTTANQVQSARIILRATMESNFTTNLFQAIAEINITNGYTGIEFTIPLKVPQKTMLKFHCIPTANGSVTTIARGWWE